MMADPLPAVQIRRLDGRVFVSFRVTTIDEQNFEMIVDQFDEVARQPSPQTVVIDLTGVRQIDELGVTILQALREGIKEVGGRSTVIGPTHLMVQRREEHRMATERGNHAFHHNQPL